MRRALFLLLALLLPGTALGQSRVGVRVGDHATHGRIVFDFPRETGYRVEEDAGRVVLRFATPAEFDLAAARRPTRNLRGIEATQDSATLAFAAGVRVRHFRLGPRVVVDLLDPEVAPAPSQAARPPANAAAATVTRIEPRPSAPRPSRTSPAPALPVAAVVPAAAPPSATPPPAVAPAAVPAPVVPVPVLPAAEPVPAPPAVPRGAPVRFSGATLTVPVSAEVGAALVARGAVWLLVLDAPVLLDLAPLRDGVLGQTELAAGPRATVLRMPASALAEPHLVRGQAGWMLHNETAAPTLRSIRPELEPGPPPRLLLRAAHPAETVAVLDPETGGTLLVGTVREGGEATPVGRRAATFEILPTRLGAAILPRADTVTLRALPAGFAAAPGPGAALALGAEPGVEAEAAGMSRIFDLPREPLPALIQRERNAALAVAGAAPLGRGLPRLRNAEALLALGLGPEAQAMVTLAMREDPRIAEDPRAHALQGAAALAGGRLPEAEGLLHPRLAESDELALWRGLLAAARADAPTPEGAARIAAALPLLRAWPEPLRARLAPLAAEALAAGGEAQAARRLLVGQDGDAAFGLARARLLEATGDAGALDAYAALAGGRDRRVRAVAMRRAIELRLASGALDAAGAAAAMESVLAAWRGDALESSARIRLAELRREAGDARGAFEALRETEQLFPDLVRRLRPLQADALLGALEQDQPLAAVALFDAHSALLPEDAKTVDVLATLAERFAALDLMDRARRVMGQAVTRAAGGEPRARIGLRLANLALEGGDPGGARAALADTEAPDLPETLHQARRLAAARALARMGATEAAVALYREAGPDAAPELAEFLAARQDWIAAAQVLRAHLDATLPAAPAPLPDGSRRLVARAAALLALAGDQPGLAALREAEGARMAGGAFDDGFVLLTSARMAGVGDLARSRQELDLARAFPGQLEALRAGAGAAR